MGKKIVFSEFDLINSGATPTAAKMIGKKYGRLTVLKYVGYRRLNKNNKYHYISCLCDCGKKVLTNLTHVYYGNCVSCGCFKVDFPSRLKHGFAPLKGKREKIYTTWQSIIKRCYNKNDSHYYIYGAAGICVCLGWRGENGFINFKNDMSPVTNKTIDRIDTTKNYSCGKCEECFKNGWKFNCRWADYQTQSNNRGSFNNIIEIDGIKMTFRQADRYLGFPIKTLQSRIKTLGWSEYDAINTPLLKNSSKRK